MTESAGKADAIIVLGGKGFVGSAIMDEGRERGLPVAAVDLDNYEEMVGTPCHILINANGNSKKYLATQDPCRDFDLSVRSVMRALTDFTPDFCVHLSSIDVYSDVTNPSNNREAATIDISAISPYAFHKHLAEQITQRYAPRWLILRMGGFVGKRLWKNSIHDMLTNQPVRVHPESRYQYQNTRELARILFELVDKGTEGEALNVAGDGVISLEDIAALIPGYTFPTDTAARQKQCYEIDLTRLKQLCSVRTTRSMVEEFVQQALANKDLIR